MLKYGLILTLTAVLVVFFALTVLYFCYSLIGKAVSGGWKFNVRSKKEESTREMTPEVAAAIAMAIEKELLPEEEVAAAVAMALEAEGYGEVHDSESYIITIRR